MAGGCRVIRASEAQIGWSARARRGGGGARRRRLLCCLLEDAGSLANASFETSDTVSLWNGLQLQALVHVAVGRERASALTASSTGSRSDETITWSVSWTYGLVRSICECPQGRWQNGSSLNLRCSGDARRRPAPSRLQAQLLAGWVNCDLTAYLRAVARYDPRTAPAEMQPRSDNDRS
jgi:hypothetical protein